MTVAEKLIHSKLPAAQQANAAATLTRRNTVALAKRSKRGYNDTVKWESGYKLVLEGAQAQV